MVSRMVGAFALPVESTGLSLMRGHVWRRVRRADAEECLQEPLASRDGRSAGGVRRHRQQRSLAQQAAAHVEFRRQRHAAELRSIDVRDSVLLRQPLVDERVIRGQQIEDAAILMGDAAEEQFDLALVCRAQVVVEIREQIHHRLAGLAASARPATAR